MRHLTRWVLAVLLALGIACAPDPPDLADPSSHPRVLIIGIDGADPEIIDNLIARGRLPVFERLRQEGAYGRLRSREPLLSPLVWTTIATGRKPQDHGILDFVEADAEGEIVPITSARRQVPALWDLASEHGLASGFVGWYASYPAARVRGFQVSDRIAFHQVKSARADTGVTHPDDLVTRLRDRFGEPEADLAATRARFIADPDADLSADGEKRLGQLAEIHATAELYRRALPDLAKQFRPDLLGVYFELVDACGHLFMEDAPPRRQEVTAQDFSAFQDTVERCYVYQDEVLADLIALAGPDTVTLVVSDHGFKSGDVRPRTSGRADTGLAGLWHRLHGIVLLHGGGVLPATTLEKASVLDIAPTVLSVLGIPLSKELPGRPLSAAFTAGTLPQLQPVESYPWSPASKIAGGGGGGAGGQALRKLQALGYINGSSAAPPYDASGRTAASHLNEGTALSVDGDIDGALKAYSRAFSLDPKNVQALTFAARLYTSRGELATAGELLERAIAVNPGSIFVRLERADWALINGDWALASAELAAAESIDDRLVQLPILKARLANATGRSDQALAELERAESLTAAESMLAEIVLFRARVAAESGHLDIAETALARAASLAPEPALAAARGDLALARGQFAKAATDFQRALENSPTDSILERKLGQAFTGKNDPNAAEKAFQRALGKAANMAEKEGAYGALALHWQRTGRDDQALETLLEATRRLPKSAALWGSLGAAHGRLGALDKALSAYERSVALGPTPLSLKTLAALVFQGDRQRAVDLWRRSLMLDPDQPDVITFLDAHGGA